MAESQGVVSFGGGPSPKTLPGDNGQTDGGKGGVVHSGAPQGWALPINATPTAIPDGPPTDLKFREAVVKLQNGSTAVAMGMKAEHLMGWLCNVKHEEAVDGKEEARSRWRLFVSLIKAAWECGTMSTQMSWVVIVLLPKRGGDYRGIGLLSPMWKVVEKSLVAQLSSVIELHNCLRGRLPRWGTGTAIMEDKLNQ
jgi:hypothetical protein